MDVAFSITVFHVLVHILVKLKLLTTKFGEIAIAVAPSTTSPPGSFSHSSSLTKNCGGCRSSRRQATIRGEKLFAKKRLQITETTMSMEGEPTRIMLAVSQSTINGYPHASISSRRAFEWTLQKIIRSNTSGFKFLFLHVLVPDEDGFDEVDSIFASPDDFKDLKQRDNGRGIQLLEFFVNRCHEIGVDCEAWLKKGDPTEVICLEAKRVQPDFLVVGSRGLGPFKRVFVGTVSEFCAKHAECPVITVKRREDETPEDPVDD